MQYVFQVRKTQFHSFFFVVRKTQLRRFSKFASALCAIPQLRLLPLSISYGSEVLRKVSMNRSMSEYIKLILVWKNWLIFSSSDIRQLCDRLDLMIGPH